MNKGMNLIERLRFCFEATIFGKTDEETLDILRKLQTDNTIVSIGKIPVHDFATAALIYLNVISYEENWNENTDYLLEVYTGFKNDYENGHPRNLRCRFYRKKCSSIVRYGLAILFTSFSNRTILIYSCRFNYGNFSDT